MAEGKIIRVDNEGDSSTEFSPSSFKAMCDLTGDILDKGLLQIFKDEYEQPQPPQPQSPLHEYQKAYQHKTYGKTISITRSAYDSIYGKNNSKRTEQSDPEVSSAIDEQIQKLRDRGVI